MKLVVDEHVHECLTCSHYYAHKGFNCKKFVRSGYCEEHRENNKGELKHNEELESN
jgi:hypothetical protein